jgi:Calcium-activated chloride channel
MQILLQCLIAFSTTEVYALNAFLKSQEKLTYFGIPVSMFSAQITTAMNVVQQWVFMFLQNYLVDFLNNFENHRTQDDFDNANIMKTALFTFGNSYVSFFYLAFIEGNQIAQLFGYPAVDGCAGYDTCMEALTYNLNTILISNLVIQNQDYFAPFLTWIQSAFSSWWLGPEANAANALEEGHELKEFADQYFNCDSNGADSSVSGALADNYGEFFKQFGFIMLFLPAYPAAAAICFLTNWIEIQGDMKSFGGTLRTLPVGAQDIGAWSDCFSALIMLAVPVNTAIVIFTMNGLDSIITEYMALYGITSSLILMKLLAFTMIQYLVFILIIVMNNLVPTVDPAVGIAQARKDVVLANMTVIDNVHSKSNVK